MQCTASVPLGHNAFHLSHIGILNRINASHTRMMAQQPLFSKGIALIKSIKWLVSWYTSIFILAKLVSENENIRLKRSSQVELAGEWRAIHNYSQNITTRTLWSFHMQENSISLCRYGDKTLRVRGWVGVRIRRHAECGPVRLGGSLRDSLGDGHRLEWCVLAIDLVLLCVVVSQFTVVVIFTFSLSVASASLLSSETKQRIISQSNRSVIRW